MTIRVKTIAFRPQQEPCEQEKGWYTLSVPQKTSPADVLPLFGIDQSSALVCVRNGNISDFDTALHEGDEILFMHAVYGG